eukprot:CAMPEP_0204206790 /NCGR_PEP_ID=MMETSP0361-20130328/71299_1 /ASSEMBLY_ACC=CAM_ASM_000343 /TAXON_ID=268821 /ORGANISM="Scrippsiella Hangoei, Strain SHTV-5" /LENGTH=107 /DNA_ID=CAMNT_0051170267 /DNA_START=16 /DNA_END=337 /DNA_ORIENTATION=+
MTPIARPREALRHTTSTVSGVAPTFNESATAPPRALCQPSLALSSTDRVAILLLAGHGTLKALMVDALASEGPRQDVVHQQPPLSIGREKLGEQLVVVRRVIEATRL